MRIINKGRRNGKSIELLYASEVTGYRIICPNHEQAEFLKKLAKELGLDIPEPMSYISYASTRGLYDETILIDNVEQIMEKILFAYFKRDICAVTMSVPIMSMSVPISKLMKE